MNKKIKKEANASIQDDKFPLPVYKKEDDIYNQEKKESFEDEDNTEAGKPGNNDNFPSGDLDVPGSELDDADEETGEEDEENNYYSLGGDNHEDLENDQGN